MYPHVAPGEVRPYPCAWAHLDSPAPTRAGGPPNALQWGKCAHTLALGPTLPRPPPAAPTAPPNAHPGVWEDIRLPQQRRRSPRGSGQDTSVPQQRRRPPDARLGGPGRTQIRRSGAEAGKWVSAEAGSWSGLSKGETRGLTQTPRLLAQSLRSRAHRWGTKGSGECWAKEALGVGKDINARAGSEAGNGVSAGARLWSRAERWREPRTCAGGR
jgi:hypothetical protein